MREKIKELFAYRKLPELITYGRVEIEDTFLSKLYDLQEKIYLLDKYLESNWEINKDELHTYWTPIKEVLSSIGLNANLHNQYLSHIYRYQEHELALREFKAISDQSLDYYYYYKSCDVKLIRRLIYEYKPSLVDAFDLSDWLYFDLVTEINDDIADLEEDHDIINGNGYILNTHLQGITNTYDTFASYLENLIYKQIRRNEDHFNQEWAAKINEWTIEQITNTINLLKIKTEKIQTHPELIAQNRIILKFDKRQTN